MARRNVPSFSPSTAWRHVRVQRWFAVEDQASGQVVHQEHLGLMQDIVHRERWARKLEWYRSRSIIPVEDAGVRIGT